MVTTRRRRRAPEVIPDTPPESPEASVRDIDVEPRALNGEDPVAPEDEDSSQSNSSSTTQPEDPRSISPMPPTTRSTRSRSSQSVASFAGPGQRGQQLLAAAPSRARYSYLNAFENMNDEFAEYLREKGVSLPRGK